MRYLALRTRRFIAFITGMVYVFSGISKLLDPVGAALVMESYMDFFHIGFLSFAAKPVAVVLALFETVLGSALMTGVWRKIAAISAFALQGFFTLLTVILVIFNPEMDCGCFGNVAHLSHRQSLVKNIFLCLMLVGAFVPFREFGVPKIKKYFTFAIVTLSLLVFTVWSWMHIPLVDYTEYAPGAILRCAESADSFDEDRYESVFVYEKDGNQETFTLEDIPDSTWTFVEARTEVREGGEDDSSVVLSFYDREGEYHDEYASQGKVMVISVYRPQGARWDRLADFAALSRKSGFRTLLLVSGLPEEIDRSMEDMQPGRRDILYQDMYMSDYKTLVSLNRSNGGVTYFSEGYLISKWAFRSIPDADALARTYMDDETEIMADRSSRARLFFQCFKLFIFGLMLLV
ncbi:MAG: DoxX family protein [Candidatus Cryptobacteroides sp.]